MKSSVSRFWVGKASSSSRSMPMERRAAMGSGLKQGVAK